GRRPRRRPAPLRPRVAPGPGRADRPPGYADLSDEVKAKTVACYVDLTRSRVETEILLEAGAQRTAPPRRREALAAAGEREQEQGGRGGHEPEGDGPAADGDALPSRDDRAERHAAPDPPDSQQDQRPCTAHCHPPVEDDSAP